MAQASRSIFEDVSENKPRPKPVAPQGENARAARIWLWILFGLIVVMILVGGLTRLTDSGLSITEWDLVMGTLPPLSETDWQALFAKYQTTQEFQLQNSAMTLFEFRSIFWWEWGHRFLGRIIGMVWLLGFLILWLRKAIRRDRLRSVFFVGLLIVVQGVIGWWMVRSGYVGMRTDVASYRLAVHLAMAFWIAGLVYWNIKMLSRSQAELVEARRRADAKRASQAKWFAGVVFAQIIFGALVAGIDGGMSYADWPLMGGEFFSSDAFALEPWWRNIFENAAFVQFLHRMNGYLLAVLALVLLWDNRHAPYRQWVALTRMMFLAIVLQIVIGITVLMRGVPIGEAILHQALAIGIWVLALGLLFAFRYPRAQHISS